MLLALLAGLALVCVLGSLSRQHRPAATYAASLAVLLVGRWWGCRRRATSRRLAVRACGNTSGRG